MTVYYIASTGSNTSPYDTWAKAATAPKTVTDLMGAGDIGYIKNETFTISADTVYTIAGSFANPARLISTNDTANAPPTTVATGALIDGSGTAGVDITVLGPAYIYGVEFKNGNSSTLASININNSDLTYLEVENCAFTIANTASGSRINIGYDNIGATTGFKSKGSTFTTGNSASQGVSIYGPADFDGDTFGITTTVPTVYFTGSRRTHSKFTGCDLSAITTTLAPTVTGNPGEYTFAQCILGSGVAPLAAVTGPNESIVRIFDCASGDTHYEFGHYTYFGNTTISASIYMNGTDGASYNAANSKHSWKITGVNGTYQTPYISPWIDVYNEATSAVTPRLEILRDGSATAYNNDEVWGEWAAKVTASSTKATLYNDRRGLVASAAAQASSALGASDWTGEGGTAWFGKLEPTSTITPAEIGHIRARVYVAGANTVYVNPKILGLA